MPTGEQSEPINEKYRPILVGTCAIFPLIHYILIRYSPPNCPVVVLTVFLGLSRIGVDLWWFSRLHSSPSRYRWLLLASAAILANVSTQIYLWRFLFEKDPTFLSGPASLLTTSAYIPGMAAVVFNFNKRDQPLVRAIDLGLCLMLAVLFVIQIDFATGIQATSAAASALFMNRLIDVENIFMLACAALQFLAADTTEDRRFFYIYLGFLALSTPVLAVRNRMAAQYPSPLWDVGLDVSPLTFLLLALNPLPAWVRHASPSAKFLPLIRSSSPIFSSLALTFLGLMLMRSNIYFGCAGILVGMIGYGLRSTLIQGRLLETEERLMATKRELEIQVSRDGLTGIPNRRFLDENLRWQWRAAVRERSPFAILMIDIDLFKNLNDAYGHQKGDECLIAVARAIDGMLSRAGDFVGRYGGEEFVVVLPGTTLEGASTVAERLRAGIASLDIRNEASFAGQVTVSIGLGVGDAASLSDPSFLIQAADEALYRAKRAGRNRIEVSDLGASASSATDLPEVNTKVPPHIFGQEAPP